MRSSITIFLTILCIAIMPANAENGSLKVGDKIPEFLGIDTDDLHLSMSTAFIINNTCIFPL